MAALDIFHSCPEVLENSLNLLPQEVVFIDPEYTILWLNKAKKDAHPNLSVGMKCYNAFDFKTPCSFCLAPEVTSIGHYLKNPVCIMTGKHRNIPRHINIIIAPLSYKEKEDSGFIEIVDNVEALYQGNIELERLNNEYENVIYALSHDLRSPLISIEGFLRKLEKAIRADDEAAINHCTTRIHANVSTMNSLVNVLLDTSRIVTGVLDLHEHDMEQIARAMAENFAGRAAEQGASIAIQGNFNVEVCDKVRIGQVYSNLIGNALKHCRETKNLTIELGAGDHIYWVRDNGPGIQKDLQDVVFEPFTQGLKTGRESFGMGMNIVYRIMQKHAGELWIESKANQGTTVFFSFKAATE
jgi:signal transduction histidine kinase